MIRLTEDRFDFSDIVLPEGWYLDSQGRSIVNPSISAEICYYDGHFLVFNRSTVGCDPFHSYSLEDAFRDAVEGT